MTISHVDSRDQTKDADVRGKHITTAPFRQT